MNYVLGEPAVVTATLIPTVGTPFPPLFSEERSAGAQGFQLVVDAIPDGTYGLLVTAVGQDGKQAGASVKLTITRSV